MRKYLVLTLVVSTLLFLTVTVSGQAEESQFPGSESSETVDAPILGWYLIPVLGAMRRHRHELNDRFYERPENLIPEDQSISYIS